ncbi:MAG: AAA family ATPase [Proteobacteria bacterium]|nr:AAA family ATPase [Pseudomonadota bacterium]
MTDSLLRERIEEASRRLMALCENIALVLRGQNDAIEMTVICFLSGGHLLIEDVPGVGKTTLACAFAQSLDLPTRRIQFTSDILPSDILGVNIYDPREARFSFHEGPIFTNILLADEINRAEPRAQSALLEAMFEHQVTVDGVTRDLPSPFMVIATQNPVDFSGTFPLPDSQLDRFLFCISLGYPSEDAERELLQKNVAKVSPKPVFDAKTLAGVMALLDEIHVSDEIIDDILKIVHATRSDARILQGASTRTMLDLRRAACARALLHRREFVLPDDVRVLAPSAIAHRIRLAPRASCDPLDVIEEIVGRIFV